jgi:hypothetical protein
MGRYLFVVLTVLSLLAFLTFQPHTAKVAAADDPNKTSMLGFQNRSSQVARFAVVAEDSSCTANPGDNCVVEHVLPSTRYAVLAYVGQSTYQSAACAPKDVLYLALGRGMCLLKDGSFTCYDANPCE